jgi:hypothetical protein
MQARPGKASSGSDLARLTAIGNLGVNARPAGFGRVLPVGVDDRGVARSDRSRPSVACPERSLSGKVMSRATRSGVA